MVFSPFLNPQSLIVCPDLASLPQLRNARRISSSSFAKKLVDELDQPKAVQPISYPQHSTLACFSIPRRERLGP